MKPAFSHLFTPPVFESDDQTFTARLLYALAWIAIVGILIVNVLTVIAQPGSLGWVTVVGLAELAVPFVILVIVRRGHTRLASILLVGSLWCVNTLSVFSRGGVNAPSLVTYLPIIFAAGLLLGELAGFSMAVLCAVAGGVMLYLGQTGQLPQPQSPANPLNLWLANVGASIILLLLQSLVSRTIWGAFKRAHASEIQYRVLHDEAPLGILVFGPDGRLQYINPGATRMLGYSREEVIGRDADSFFEPEQLKQLPLARIKDLPASGNSIHRERIMLHKDGSFVWVYGIVKGMPNGFVQYVFNDYTERHAALDALQASESRFRNLIQHLKVGVLLQNARSEMLLCNQAALDMLGLTEAQLLGKSSFDPSWNVIHEDGSPFPGPTHPVPQAIATAQPVRDVVMGVYRPTTTDRVWLLVNAEPQLDANGSLSFVICTFTDITQQKRQERLRESLYQISEAAHTVQNLQALFRSIHLIIAKLIQVNNFYIALYDPLQQQLAFPYGVDERDTDWSPRPLRRGLTEYVLRTGQPLLAPPAVYDRLLAAREIETIGARPIDWLGVPLQTAGRVLGVLTIQTYSETTRYTEDDKDMLVYVSTQVAAAIERGQASAALRASEERFRMLIENSADGVSLTNERGIVSYISPAIESILGYSVAEFVGHNTFELIHPDDYQNALKVFGPLVNQPLNTIATGTFRYRHRNGSWRWLEAIARNLLGDPHVLSIVVNFRDVTERKRHEQEQAAIVTMAAALRTAQSRAEMLPVLLDELAVLLGASATGLDMVDPATDEIVTELARGEWAAITGLRNPANVGVTRRVLASGELFLQDNIQSDPEVLHPELYGTVQFIACAPLIVRDLPIGALWAGWPTRAVAENLHLLPAVSDIAANAIQRATLHEQTEQRLKRLTALHKIDTAITASFDLATTLQTVLEQAVTELHASAADVLFRQPDTEELFCVASRGFRSPWVDQSILPPTDPLVEPILRERQTTGRSYLTDSLLVPARATMLAGENFVSYYGTPLIVKDGIKAILEVWLRDPIKADAEWIDFFETLAGQTAVAIENFELFDQLQRSNAELTTAYDATIEGWSRALDLRDHETEGHTQRVTAMALKLAQAVGLSNEELLYVRWGSLLHDIGKMGVPDEILLKPGPLTVEEWMVMRRHPVYARQMLLPIAYLKPAIDIAYSHHERWDGSGYPQGLKGEAIPLAARIFTVVDVWDALRSDRPYRLGWTVQQTREYIELQSGKHFDPQVVKVFLGLNIGV